MTISSHIVHTYRCTTLPEWNSSSAPLPASDDRRASLIARIRRGNLFYDDPRQTVLSSAEQSLLQCLAEQERPWSGFPNFDLRSFLQCFDKVPFNEMVGKCVGHRPPTLAWIGTSPPSQLASMLEEGPVYVKGNGSMGSAVDRLTRTELGYRVQHALGREHEVSTIADCLRLHDSREPDAEPYLAEAQIAIAPTLAGRTWELRLLPPLSEEFSYVKLGRKGAVANNIAVGGERMAPTEVLREVVLTRFPDADAATIETLSTRFLDEATQVAHQVNALSDAIQLEKARELLLPEDFRHPDEYEEVMADCFAGNFLVVDITGTWNERDELAPVIIEAQNSAALPEGIAATASRAVRDALTQKIATLGQALRG